MRVCFRRSFEPGYAPDDVRPREIFVNAADRILHYGAADGSQHRLDLSDVPDSFLDLLTEGTEIYSNTIQHGDIDG